MNSHIKVFFLLLVLAVVSSCDNNNRSYTNLINQLPDTGLVLIPDNIISDESDGSGFVYFSKIVEMQTDSNRIFNEDEFYASARSMGAMYILIPSHLHKEKNVNFPWMANNKFRVCPGGPDKSAGEYFILLNWDNTKNSFHFYKFLYNEE